MTYSSVVSRDSVRIMFLIAALNDLDLRMCDIGNVYQAETPDGNIHEYTANVIAERLWEQVDDDGWEYGLLYEKVLLKYQEARRSVSLQLKDGIFK